MPIVLLSLLSVACGLSWGYQSTMHNAILYVGKLLAPPGTERYSSTGHQDAITPPQHKTNQAVSLLLLLATTALALYAGWFWLPASIILALVVSGAMQAIRPKDVEFYLVHIMSAMANREADYLLKKDAKRAEAARYFIDEMESLLHHIEGSDLRVPSLDEIRKMPLGGYPPSVIEEGTENLQGAIGRDGKVT